MDKSKLQEEISDEIGVDYEIVGQVIHALVRRGLLQDPEPPANQDEVA